MGRTRVGAEIQLRAHEWFELPQGPSLPNGRGFFQLNIASVGSTAAELVFYTKKLVKSQR